MTKWIRRVALATTLLMFGALATGCGSTAASGADSSGSGGAGVPPVADTAMYRGTVTERSEEGDTLRVTLAQAEGTDYGAPTLTLEISGDTRLEGVTAEEIEAGNYLEVYYAGEQALTVKKLMDAEAVVYNGTVLEVRPGEDDDTGSLLMQDHGGTNTTVFHYGADTQFYMDKKDLVEGAELNILSTGVYALSLPAQGQALEIRPFAG